MSFFFFFFCLGWPGNLILPISAYQVARIIGVSYQCLTGFEFLILPLQPLQCSDCKACISHFLRGKFFKYNVGVLCIEPAYPWLKSNI
jgi:hypothetical protein